MWRSPIWDKLIQTADSNSFATMPDGYTGLPIENHCGAFGVTRKHHIHEGIDLYARIAEPVLAVESGEVVAVMPFTGPHAGSPWWKNTYAVFVEGESGVVVYGEIASHVKLHKKVNAGELIGVVLRVLVNDKGRPVSMLHLELHQHGSRKIIEWQPGHPKPELLLDPTPFMLHLTN